MSKEMPANAKEFVSSLKPLQKIDYLIAVLHAQEVEADSLKATVAKTLASQYDVFKDDPDYDDMEQAERDIKSGMLIQLSNITEELGRALEVEDFNQWRFDCGMRVCGTPQVGICDYCQSLGSK